MQELFIVISSLLALISPLVYARSILKGKVKPHRTTKFVLLIITILTTLTLIAQHDHVAIYLAAVSAIQSIILFTLSIKYGMGGWSKVDLLCLIIALIGITVWQATDNPILGLYAAIAADFTGMIPALIKTYHYPETEIFQYYLLDTFAGGFSLLALSTWSLQTSSYPLYIMVINLAMVLLVIRPTLQKRFSK